MKYKMKFNNFILHSYGICVFLYAILQTNLSIQYPAIKFIIMGTFVAIALFDVLLKFLLEKNINKFVFFVVCLLALLFLYEILVNGFEDGTVFVVIFCFIMERQPEEKIMKKYSEAIFLSIVFVLILTSGGIIQNTVTATNLGITREYLGYIWASFGANMLLSGTLAYYAYKQKKVKVLAYLAILIINYYFYAKTKTKAPFACIILATVLSLLGRLDKLWEWILKKRAFRWISYHFAILMATFTIGFQLFYNKYSARYAFLQALDRAMSFRLSFGDRAFNIYKITLFGQKVTWTMSDKHRYFYLDSSYLNILFTAGLLILLLMCFMMDEVNKKAVRDNNYYLLMMCMVFLFHCVTDPQLVDFRNNPFILLALPSLQLSRKMKGMKRGHYNYRSLESNI